MNKNRVAILLSSGIDATKVATIVGCTPSRISQMKAEDPEFQLMLEEYTANAEKADAEEVAMDAEYLTSEHLLIKKVQELVPLCDMKEAIMALKVVSERKVNTTAPVNTGQVVTNNHITLNLPSHIVAEHAPVIDITASKEIVAIDDVNLSPLPSLEVTKLFKEMSHTIGEENESHSGRNISSKDRESKKAVPITDTFLSTSRTLASA